MGQTKRELVDISTWSESQKREVAYGSNHPDYRWITMGIEGFDTDKGFTDEFTILKASDGKFFKLCYQNWGCGEYEFENVMQQVFARPTIEYK